MEFQLARKVFQYHNGSIATKKFYKLVYVKQKFQYHNGSIATVFPLSPSEAYEASFNTIMVRLQLVWPGCEDLRIIKFQYHNGSIATFKLFNNKDDEIIVSIP